MKWILQDNDCSHLAANWGRWTQFNIITTTFMLEIYGAPSATTCRWFWVIQRHYARTELLWLFIWAEETIHNWIYLPSTPGQFHPSGLTDMITARHVMVSGWESYRTAVYQCGAVRRRVLNHCLGCGQVECPLTCQLSRYLINVNVVNPRIQYGGVRY